jgi:hypothetical protein
MIKDGQARKGGHGDFAAKLSEARAALAREQTAALRLRNAVSRGDYVSRAGIRREIESMFRMLRERLLSIPGKIADTCEMRSRGEVEGIIRDDVYEALDEILRLDGRLVEQRGQYAMTRTSELPLYAVSEIAAGDHQVGDPHLAIAHLRRTIVELKKIAELEQPAAQWIPLKLAAFGCGLEYETARTWVVRGLVETPDAGLSTPSVLGHVKNSWRVGFRRRS